MRSLSLRFLLSSVVTFVALSSFGHDITITGTQNFASLDGSSSDHDGLSNGVFTVDDGNLTVNGTVNCNDGLIGGPCAMTFSVSGDMTMNAGSALYSEDRLGVGSPASITLNVGGNLTLNGTSGSTPGALVSAAALVTSVAGGGNVTANVTGTTTVGAGATIDAGSFNGTAGKVTINGSGPVSVNGNLYAGPSRAPSGLMGGYLFGGGGLQKGGEIVVKSTTFAEPAVTIGGTAAIITQGETQGTGPITIDGCGIEVKGLIASTSRQNTSSRVSIRSGKNLTIDSRDLGVAGATLGRKGNVRADGMLTGGAQNRRVDLFAAGNITILGPAAGSSSVYPLSSSAHALAPLVDGGTIRIISLDGAVTASGRVADASSTFTGGEGGNIQIASKSDANLDTAHLRAIGQYSLPVPGRAGGDINVRSHSGNVIWTNGNGDVRPIGSSSGLPPSQQGTITLTACGTVNTTGTSFPANGVPTGVFPVVVTGACSPAAPSLPVGVPPLVTCNTPPVANDTNASTNEDTTVTINLSGSDADGDPLTFSIVSGPSNGTLGPIIPTGPTTATVDYTPNLNYFGPDSFVYQANDGNGGTDNATASITVNPVNDPPSFLAGPMVIVLEDSGAYSAAWASAISAGPANESGQTVTFIVTNDNNALFAVQPAVDSAGTLTFTPAANAHGTANLTIVAQDDGGTANGGDDTSNPQFSAINVTAVNDEPSFTPGGNVAVNEDSGAYSAPWASGISAGPNEGSQSVTFVVTNDNNALFSAQPAIDASGVLTFTPAADASGTANVTVYLTDNGGTANGGDDTSPSVNFTITVNSVNDAPSFVGGGDVTVNEDSGAYSAAWATSISAGPANESGQTLTFNITGNTNPALFASGPSISSTGVLSFTLAADAFGSADITVTLSDDGGTANGGIDTSAPQSFTITVNSVNDAPSFTPGGNVTVNEDSGAYSAPWATSISAGPANEAGQTVAFNTSNDNNALFSVQPSISTTGVLTFTPAPNAFGSANVSVYLQDNGGTANGGDDTSATVNFVITVNSINDPPVAGNDAWETEGNTELRVDLAPGATPHVADTTPSGNGVADNDGDPIEGDPVVITGVVGCADVTAPFDCAVTGGNVSLNANGSFSFLPSQGATSGSFQYNVSDGTDTATATVTITIHDMIWYVNGSAPGGGDGTSDAPFNSFASLNGVGDADGPGDYIFVHTSAVTGSIALEPSQKFWGQGVGLIIPRNLNGNGFPTTIVAPGARPTVTAIAGDTVLVDGVTGVEIAGLNIVSPSGNGIDVTSGAAAASASIYSNSVNAAGGEGIDINAGSAAGTSVAINTTDVVAMGDGINLLATDGAVVFSYSNGNVTSLTGSGIVVNGSAADSLVINGMANVTIGAGTPGQGISVSNATFDANPGTAAFETVSAGNWTVASNASPAGGNAVSLVNVSGDLAWGSLSAYGTTGGVSVAGTGAFTGVAGMRVTSGGGAIRATAGVGLSVTNATIDAAGLNFTSVAAANAANGIVLNNTGAGGLTVHGDGSLARNGSGGTLDSISGDAVQLVNANNVTLRSMNITNTGSSPASAAVAQSSAGNHAVDMNGGSSLVLSGVLIDNPRGTALLVLNAGGTNAVNSDSLITNLTATAGHGIYVNNLNTNMALFAFDDSAMTNNASVHPNFFFVNTGTSNMRVDVVNGSVFENIVTQAVTAAAGGTAATTGTLTTNIGGPLASNGNIFRNGAGGGAGDNSVAILVNNGAAHVALVQNNLFDNIAEIGLVANTSIIRTQNSGGRLDAVIDANTIQNIHYPSGGRHVIGHIFEPLAFNASDYSNVEISNNTAAGITYTGTNREMVFIDYRPTAAGGSVKILNNVGTFTSAGNQQAMELRFRQTNPSTVNLQVAGNSITQNTTSAFIDIDAEAVATVNTTVINNSFTNPSATPGQMIDVATEAATATACANISGNTLTPGSITVNEILGTLNVTQASSAALSAANGGAVVTVGGSPAFGQPACALP